MESPLKERTQARPDNEWQNGRMAGVKSGNRFHHVKSTWSVNLRVSLKDAVTSKGRARCCWDILTVKEANIDRFCSQFEKLWQGRHRRTRVASLSEQRPVVRSGTKVCTTATWLESGKQHDNKSGVPNHTASLLCVTFGLQQALLGTWLSQLADDESGGQSIGSQLGTPLRVPASAQETPLHPTNIEQTNQPIINRHYKHYKQTVFIGC